ncbi:unnamed protein product [Effrenium voratum]|nr:unnamed protein product [Effrenium voratum]
MSEFCKDVTVTPGSTSKPAVRCSVFHPRRHPAWQYPFNFTVKLIQGAHLFNCTFQLMRGLEDFAERNLSEQQRRKPTCPRSGGWRPGAFRLCAGLRPTRQVDAVGREHPAQARQVASIGRQLIMLQDAPTAAWEALMPALGAGQPKAVNRLYQVATSTTAGQRSANAGVAGHPLDMRVMRSLLAAADARLRT